MRLTEEDRELIKKSVKTHFGESAKVYLFGSRADDTKRGGDIDLYIETEVIEGVLQKKLKLIGELHYLLGEQKIDIVINNFLHDKYIFEVAKNEGILL